MALTIPNTFTTGTPAVAAEVNGNFTAVKTEVDLKIGSTIVDAKGDLIVATAADTVARQAVGSNGQVLVADSGVTNGVAWVDPQTNRNVIINGAMQVAQRGTSTAGITSDASNRRFYTADRFGLFMDGFGTWTQSLEADAPTGSGFRNSLKMLCTTAAASPAASAVNIIQNISEGQNVQQFLKGTASAKPFSMSFWVKSNVTGTYIAELLDIDNSRQVSASYTVAVSGTWEKKTIVFPADTTGAFDNDNARSLDVNFYLGAGTDRTSGTLQTTWATTVNANRAVGQTNVAAATNNYWQVTGVQLEAGAVATPFEFENIGTTLAKCQRYYYRVLGPNAYNTLGNGIVGSATTTGIQVQFPVTMRIANTSVEFSTLALQEDIVGGVFSVTGVSLANAVTQLGSIAVTVASGMTQFRPARLLTNNSSSGYIAFSSEL
jgi:hypothetical protein